MKRKLLLAALAIVTLIAAEGASPRTATSQPANCWWLDCIDGYSILCCPGHCSYC
jgi:hypothetical protein